jgi:hypothetical protein
MPISGLWRVLWILVVFTGFLAAVLLGNGVPVAPTSVADLAFLALGVAIGIPLLIAFQVWRSGPQHRSSAPSWGANFLRDPLQFFYLAGFWWLATALGYFLVAVFSGSHSAISFASLSVVLGVSAFAGVRISWSFIRRRIRTSDSP